MTKSLLGIRLHVLAPEQGSSSNLHRLQHQTLEARIRRELSQVELNARGVGFVHPRPLAPRNTSLHGHREAAATDRSIGPCHIRGIWYLVGKRGRGIELVKRQGDLLK